MIVSTSRHLHRSAMTGVATAMPRHRRTVSDTPRHENLRCNCRQTCPILTSGPDSIRRRKFNGYPATTDAGQRSVAPDRLKCQFKERNEVKCKETHSSSDTAAPTFSVNSEHTSRVALSPFLVQRHGIMNLTKPWAS